MEYSRKRNNTKRVSRIQGHEFFRLKEHLSAQDNDLHQGILL